MLLILIGFMIGFGVTIIFSCLIDGEKVKDSLLPAFGIGLLPALAALLIAQAPPINYICPIIAEGTYEIQMMNDTSAISGSTYLFFGDFQENAVYTCYMKIKYEGYTEVYKHIAFPVNYSVVIEENISKPYVKVVTENTPTNICKIRSYKGLKNYEFHVPPNSIKPMVNLDLEK